MNVQEELKELKERIAELEEKVKGEREFPKIGDKYWYLGETGEILYDNWDNVSFEKDMLEIGNVFKTKEETKFAVEKLKVEAELREFSKPFKRDTLNFLMCFDTDEDKIYIETKRFMVQGAFYFECKTATCSHFSSVTSIICNAW